MLPKRIGGTNIDYNVTSEDCEDEAQLYCPVSRTYCDSEFCEGKLCERMLGIDPDEEEL